MNEYLILAKEWWNNLQSRERLYVAAGSIALIVMLLWSMVWDPLADGVENLQSNVAQQQDDLRWMQQAAAQIKQMQGSQPSGSDNQSLLGLLEGRINALGLKPALQRMNPEGSNQVKFWLNHGSFDQLTTLFGELEQQHGVKVISLSVTTTEQPGLVDARVTVIRGG
jgi:general secretion pathway protein M